MWLHRGIENLVDIGAVTSVSFVPVRTRATLESRSRIHTLHSRKTSIVRTFNRTTSKLGPISGHSLWACTTLVPITGIQTRGAIKTWEMFAAYRDRFTAIGCSVTLHSLWTVPARVTVGRFDARDAWVTRIGLASLHGLTTAP